MITFLKVVIKPKMSLLVGIYLKNAFAKIFFFKKKNFFFQPKNNFLGIFFFIPLGNKVYEGFGTFSGILFNDNFTQFFYRKFKTRSLNFISRVFHFFSLQFLQSGILFLFFSR